MADQEVLDPENPSVEVIDLEPLPEEVAEPESAARARELGWVPQEEWKSAPERWRSADEFLQIHDNVASVVKRENSSLKSQLERLALETAELRQADRERKAQQEQFKLDTLRLERDQALENGDHVKAAQIGDKLAEQRQAPPPATQGQIQVSPEVQQTWSDFATDPSNKWIGEQKNQQRLELEMRMLRTAGVTAQGKDFLDLAVDRMKRMYPEEFQQRKAPAMAEGGGRQSSGAVNGSRSWNDLKPEIRTDLEDLIRATPSLTKAGILKRCTADQFKR